MSKKKKPAASAEHMSLYPTADGFRNMAMKLGIAAPGDEGSEDNLISRGHYNFNLITRNRIQLEAAYRGSWIVGRVVDCVAEDMTKVGIILNTNEGAEKIQDLKVQMSRLQIWQTIKQTVAWGRLYGGAIGVLQIKGQKLDTPLDPETVQEGQFLGIAVYDRWQLNPVLTHVIMEGPDIGLPMYYDIVLGSNLNDPGQVPGQGSQSVAPLSNEATLKTETGQTAGGPGSSRVRVHHSRCFRTGGHKLPFFQAITEMMWDESIIERMWDRLVEFETVTAATGGLVGRALLRTISVDGLREILAAGGDAAEALTEQFEYVRLFQQNEGITLLDKNDVFQTASYTFSGLSDIIERFGEQLSGASETPLVRLFGQSPAGLGGNGDTDIRNYYDSINAKQESTLRNPVEMLLKVLWRSIFGQSAPKDLAFTFTPLWQMSALDKANIAKTQTDAVIAAHQEGLVSAPTAMNELKQSSADTGLFTHISDEEIAEAENEPPPAPEEEPSEPDVPGTKPGNESVGEPGEGPSQLKAKDNAWRRFSRWFDAGEWNEGKHEKKHQEDEVPTNTTVKKEVEKFEKGSLKSGSGATVTNKKQALAIGYSESGKDEDAKVTDDQKTIRDWLKK